MSETKSETRTWVDSPETRVAPCHSSPCKVLTRWAPRDPSRTTKRPRPETTTPSLPTANRPSTRVVSTHCFTYPRTGERLTHASYTTTQFSESLINHLSSQSLPSSSSSSSVPASRQQALDAHIQQRIAAELQQLRQQEQQVRQEIERALERENLDRERGASPGSGAGGQEEGKPAALSHSASLLKDLEQLEKRASGLKKERAETAEWKAVDVGKEALERCFRSVAQFPPGLHSREIDLPRLARRDNRQTPLNCRAEAEKFKAAVAGVEKASLD